MIMVSIKIMLKHLSVSLFFGVFLTAIAGVAAPSLARAAQFSADVTIVTYGKAAKGKVYVRGETYRMELVKGDQSVVVLVDDKAGLTRVLVNSKNTMPMVPGLKLSPLLVLTVVVILLTTEPISMAVRLQLPYSKWTLLRLPW